MDEQKDAKDEKEKSAIEEQARIAEDSLLTGGAIWDISTSSRGLKSQKRESEKPGKKKSKKRKMELLVGWGEDYEDEKDDQEVVDNWLSREEPPEARKSSKMRELLEY